MTPEEAFRKWWNSGKVIKTDSVVAKSAWLEATRQAYEDSIQAVLDAGGDNVDYHADAIRKVMDET